MSPTWKPAIGEITAAVPHAPASVISPIAGFQVGDKYHQFYSETEVGPVTKKLYDELTGIQFGDKPAPEAEGWVVRVD